MTNRLGAARRGTWSGRLFAGLLFSAAMSAHAVVITFDFDALPYNSGSTPKTSKTTNGITTTVDSYMTSVFGAPVTVVGEGWLSNNGYTGDGYVVGPAASACTLWSNGTCTRWNWSATALTLGNTEGGVNGGATAESPAPTSTNPDNYIVNHNSNQITITFANPIYSASFDFEIFPDGTCPTLTSCGGASLPNLPDFTFKAGDIVQFVQLGSVPDTAAGFYKQSPHSVQSAHGAVAPNEKAPQWLGESGTWYFDAGVTKLEFVDWPRRIGIDNLVVDTECTRCRPPEQSVPEPPTLPIVALALGLWAVASRYSRRAKGARNIA